MKETEEILYNRCSKGTTAELIPKTFQDVITVPKELRTKKYLNFIKRDQVKRGLKIKLLEKSSNY